MFPRPMREVRGSRSALLEGAMKRISHAAPAAILAATLAATLLGASGARAGEIETGGKLLLTHGVSALEGGAGGGLATWAVIAGAETDHGIGGEVHGTYVDVKNYK